MRYTKIAMAAFGIILLFGGCDTLQQVAAQEGVFTSPGGTPTSTEMSSGLKQALQIGLQQGVQQVSATDGFFKNALIKIVFPPDAQKVEKTLRSLGLNQLCDQTILSLNRAAESAAKKATPIFMNALKQMSFRDVSDILLGGTDTAATNYFRRSTTAQLKAEFKPVISSSLAEVGATRYWTDVTTRYNQIPLVKDVNPDLTDYVTQRAIDGLFVMIADKEKQIRGQLGARTTPLLKKVFGYAAQQKAK